MSGEEDKNKFSGDYEPMDYGCDYTDNIPKILHQLNISLAFTSYQAAKLILVRSDNDSLDINYQSFSRPMGLSASENSITLGTFAQIINFHREDGLLEKIKQPLLRIEDDITAPRVNPKNNAEDENKSDHALNFHTSLNQSGDNVVLSEEEKEQQKKDKKKLEKYQRDLYQPVDERVDACFIARSSHYSGMINIHDIDWGDEGLWVVNSSFSCLCTVEPDFSFVPRWKPFFISDLQPEDRCHLNGMTLKDGKPAYVTTFSQSDKKADWRDNDKNSGTLMDVAENKILLDGLAMPHSPRWYQQKIYFCNSGHGLICSYDPESKETEVIAELPGFTRGMDFFGPLLLVGLSKVRAGEVTRPAPIAEKYEETFSGIWFINLEDNSIVGQIKFTGNVDQIYDVAVIPNCSFPELIEPTHPRIRNHFSHPELVNKPE